METIGSARAWAARRLEQAGVESASLTADLLLGHILGWSRVQVLTRPEVSVDVETLALFKALVERRGKGEPLQYLTGEQEFYGLRFRVTEDVLIPRPETETLVEKAVNLARGMRAHMLRFADVGTGSGCISVAFVHEVPAAQGCAVDTSLAALRIARANALRHGVADRIGFLCCDVLEAFPETPLFDLILSNPPYVANAEYNDLPREVREHEPHPALFAGASGLDVLDRLIQQAAARLVHGGYLLMEIGVGQADAVTKMMLPAVFGVESVLDDLQGIPRCVVARKL